MSLLHAQNHYNFYQRDTTSQATSSTSSGKISPAILFIIIILAVIFFICGVLHLLVRFFMKQRSSSISQSSVDENEIDVVSDTFQRQLQQLFHLHDSGLDQAFIDALPVFQYKEIVVGGLKEPFDCAVCLCEFSVNDKLRLLPLCTHAFHIDCIDKWLLSNSTCPLCRAALYSPGLGFQNPIFDFDDNEVKCRGRKSFEGDDVVGEKKVFPVRLGKFRSTTKDGHSVVDVGETSSLDVRRCYSMGSYEYVVDDSVLQVALCPNAKSSEEQNQDCRTMTVVSSASATADAEARKIINVGSKKESLSVSKIWLWSKKGRFSNSSNADFGGVDMSLPWTNKGLAS